jgi:transcriptional regulator with XRE-family HTH domain
MITESPDILSEQIADRVRTVRAALGLSLDALAAESGVSRSTISLIERGETSPTAAVLAKLAGGLGLTLAQLFDAGKDAESTDGVPVSRRATQVEWRDPASGYRRRNVSVADRTYPVQVVDVHFPAGARVAFDNVIRDAHASQQIWILDGAMRVTVGGQQVELREGDCMTMPLDRPVLFHNPTRKAARYAVVLLTERGRRQ